MKTVNANPNRPLSPAEQEAWDQFQASEQRGQALFHPIVDPQNAAPHCVVFLEAIGRLVLRFMPGNVQLKGSQWLSQDADGDAVPMPNPLKEIWRSADTVRDMLKPRPEIGVYAIPVLVFSDMEPDASILAEAQKRKVRALFGLGNLVTDLVDLPSETEMRTDFASRYIDDEMAVLQCSHDEGTVAAKEDAEKASDAAPPAVEGSAGAITIQRVDVMNLYVTIVCGGAGDTPPLITVQGQ